MTRFLCPIFFLVCLNYKAQNINRDYYLIGNINWATVSKSDSLLIDSSINNYHNHTADTIKLYWIDHIAENSDNDEIWPKYNQLLFEFLDYSHYQYKSYAYQKYLSKYYNNKGYELNRKGNTIEALSFYEKSLEIDEKHQNKEAISYACNNIGYIHKLLGNIELALKFYHKSLSITEQLKDEKTSANTLNNLGALYEKLEDFRSADKYYTTCLNLRKQLNDTRGSIISHLNLGGLYKRQGSSNASLKQFEFALALATESKDVRMKAVCFNNLAVHFLDKGDTSLAINYNEKSLQIKDSLNDKKGISTSLNNLSSIYLAQGNIIQALMYAHRSYQLSEELGIPDKIEKSALLLSNAFYEGKNFERAINFYRIHIKMRDSVINESSRQMALEAKTKYAYELLKRDAEAKHKIEFELQEAEINTHKQLIYISLTGIALIFILLILLFRHLKVTKNQKYQIEEQRRILNESQLSKDILLRQEAETKKNLEEAHQKLNDSIQYGSYIQQALLTSDDYWTQMFPNHFLILQPLGLVSGDFYWSYQTDDNLKIWVTADCTGHGVPGAFMSMLGNAFLNEVIIENKITRSGEILNELRKLMIKVLNKTSQIEIMQGMELSVCILHEEMILEYSGANHPVLLTTSSDTPSEFTVLDKENRRLIEIKPHKEPIGMFSIMTPFPTNRIKVQSGDKIYTFSDGFSDQFGGERNKKFGYKRFKELILETDHLPPDLQKQFLLDTIKNWKGDANQLDDICLVCVVL